MKTYIPNETVAQALARGLTNMLDLSDLRKVDLNATRISKMLACADLVILGGGDLDYWGGTIKGPVFVLYSNKLKRAFGPYSSVAGIIERSISILSKPIHDQHPRH